MPGPILFFIIIIAIDLILKSAKDKKNIDEARRRRTQELNKQPTTPTPSRSMADLRKILEEEIQKERQREMARKQRHTTKQSTLFNEKRPNQDKVNKKADIKERTIEVRKDEENLLENRNVYNTPVKNEVKNKEVNLREDILRGIIFSEILSEPKSLQNQRRSL